MAPEFIATHLQDWLKKIGIKPMQIYPGSPWENGYNERFNGTLRKEVLNAEWFHTTSHGREESLDDGWGFVEVVKRAESGNSLRAWMDPVDG